MNQLISKLEFQKALKSCLVLLKDKSIAYNDSKLIHIYTNSNNLYLKASGNFNELTLKVCEYDIELNIVVNYQELNDTVSLMGAEIVMKESNNKDFLLISDGKARVKLITDNESHYTLNDINLDEKLANVKENGTSINKEKMLYILKYLRGVMPNKTTNESATDIYFNGICAFMSDDGYLTRLDIETPIQFVMSKSESAIVQSMLSIADDEDIYVSLNRSDTFYAVGDMLYEISSSEHTIKDVSGIINNFVRDDYFKVDIKETIKYIKLAKLFSGNDLEADVIFEVKNGVGLIKADSLESTSNSKFVAENGIESNFGVNILEILTVLGGISSLDIENTLIQVDSENECIYFEFGLGDCYMAMNNYK